MNVNLVKQYEAGGRQEEQLRDRRERWERGTGRPETTQTPSTCRTPCTRHYISSSQCSLEVFVPRYR